jgi:Rrf2 family protein
MYELALHYGEGVKLLKDIAGRMEISEKYLSNLAIPLKNGGLVNTVRGSHGGYELIKSPDTVSVKEIYQLLEGDTMIIDCIGDADCCSHHLLCPTRDMWAALQENILNFMEGISLQDLIDQNKNKMQEYVLMYHI